MLCIMQAAMKNVENEYLATCLRNRGPEMMTSNAATDPLCKHCGRPVLLGDQVWGQAGIYHRDCCKSPYGNPYPCGTVTMPSQWPIINYPPKP
jgi:hypothetical protein